VQRTDVLNQRQKTWKKRIIEALRKKVFFDSTNKTAAHKQGGNGMLNKVHGLLETPVFPSGVKSSQIDTRQ
jgi:hypothetical protein